MPDPTPPFHESHLWKVPIKELGLTIAGTRLEPIVRRFKDELLAAGVRRLRPKFYLSTEWGVPFGTVSIAIPFYLARPELVDAHAMHVGHVEGFSPTDILRYLRHEMGHVVNYAYQLYEQEEWVKHFGAITQPYVEEYRPEPFSRRFVIHLPGWYAQKHPDEDWAETFAVWMTPGRDWRADYAAWPEALAKLDYCDGLLRRLADQEPLTLAEDPDEDVGQLTVSLDQYYRQDGGDPESLPGLDGALRAIFENLGEADETAGGGERRPAAGLIRKLERELMANIFQWTGHFPERTRHLLRDLARRAERLEQVYPAGREAAATVALTTLVTALAANFVYRGAYLP